MNIIPLVSYLEGGYHLEGKAGIVLTHAPLPTNSRPDIVNGFFDQHDSKTFDQFRSQIRQYFMRGCAMQAMTAASVGGC